MSSEDSLVASLIIAEKNIYKLGGPILIGIGTVSCILSSMVFMRKNLRKSPFSIYFVAYNVCSLLLIYTVILISTISNGFDIDLTTYNLAFCRFRYYTVNVFDILSPCYIILASIDRVLITSRNALTRQRSTHRLAYISIITITIFWSLVHIHALFFPNMIQIGPDYFVCYYTSTIYMQVTTYYAIIKVILIPLLMIIFGLWAVKNVRGLGHVAPASIVAETETIVIRDVRASHSKDRQLLQILLIDISLYVIFNLMMIATLIYQQFPLQSYVQSQITFTLLVIAAVGPYIPPCIGCYTNLLVSKTFRQEVKNILMCK